MADQLTQEGWRVIRGRCLPYGDGITYWPIAEIVYSIAGIDAETDQEEAITRLRELGLGESAIVRKMGGSGPFLCQINGTRMAIAREAAASMLVEPLR